jgi:hypothetical protein
MTPAKITWSTKIGLARTCLAPPSLMRCVAPNAGAKNLAAHGFLVLASFLGQPEAVGQPPHRWMKLLLLAMEVRRDEQPHRTKVQFKLESDVANNTISEFTWSPLRSD